MVTIVTGKKNKKIDKQQNKIRHYACGILFHKHFFYFLYQIFNFFW